MRWHVARPSASLSPSRAACSARICTRPTSAGEANEVACLLDSLASRVARAASAGSVMLAPRTARESAPHQPLPAAIDDPPSCHPATNPAGFPCGLEHSETSRAGAARPDSDVGPGCDSEDRPRPDPK